VVEKDQKGPDIMREEIFEAFKCMKKGKAAGIDDVPAEFLKMIEGETLKKFVDLVMYEIIQYRYLARRFY
jgi:hypothetical protein